MEPFFRESDENRKSRPDRAPVRVRPSARSVDQSSFLSRLSMRFGGFAGRPLFLFLPLFLSPLPTQSSKKSE